MEDKELLKLLGGGFLVKKADEREGPEEEIKAALWFYFCK